MKEFVPPHYITPKIDFFSSVGDPESHLKAFRNQMIFFGGLDAIRCKMLMGTFTGIALQCFSGILDGHITSFPQFSRGCAQEKWQLTVEAAQAQGKQLRSFH